MVVSQPRPTSAREVGLGCETISMEVVIEKAATAISLKEYEQHPQPHGSSFSQHHMGHEEWCGLREPLPCSDRSVKAVRMKSTVWNNGKSGREA